MCVSLRYRRSEEHTSELQSHRDLHSFPTRRSSDLRAVSHSPISRYMHSLAYSNSSGRTVLFGGYIGGAFLGDTWAFDGMDWTQVLPSLSPPAREGCASAYDIGDRKSTRLNSSHTEIYTLSLHDALPICGRSAIAR